MNKLINISFPLLESCKTLIINNNLNITISKIINYINNSFYKNILYNIGLFLSSKFIIELILFIKDNYICNNNDLNKIYGNGWVIIIGNTSELDLSFAKILSKKGFKILLINKGEQLLNEAIKNIKKNNKNIIINSLPFNFDKEYNEDELRLLQFKLSEYLNDISILYINSDFINLNNFNDKFNENLYNINSYIKSYTFLNKIIINKMIDLDRKSLIINSFNNFHNNKHNFIYKSLFYYQQTFLNNINKYYNINTSLILIDNNNNDNIVYNIINKIKNNSFIYIGRNPITNFLLNSFSFYINKYFD